ncbi:uncharacterized protein O3C94_003721 [Discoglossus pictus]
MQDTIDQRVGAFVSQKNHYRKGSGSSDENTNTRKIKLQTSFPPIHLSLISNCKSLDKKHKEHGSNLDIPRDVRGEKINLPQVEKVSEKISKPVKSFPDKSKYTKDYGCNISSLSNTPTFTYDGQKDTRVDKQTWLDVPLPKSASERLSPEIGKFPECPSCKNERRIRSDYDKILMQSKREKEVLQQKVGELETELKRYEDVNRLTKKGEENFMEEGSLLGNTERSSSAKGWEDFRKLEEKNKEKQDQIDCLLIEIEELKAQLHKMQDDERKQEHFFNSKQSKLAFDVEDLKLQIERAKEHEKLKVSNLDAEKENILIQLESTKNELEKYKKRKSFLVAELRKEKDCCLMEIEKLKAFTEKVKAENASLSDTVKLLQQDLDSRALCSCFTPQVYSAGAEVLLISHRDSPEHAHAVGTDYNYQEICSCGQKIKSLSSSSKEAMTQMEEDEVRVKELYKQLKRERNLLLDVMVIMYDRRWFLEEAVPHVKRALRKCGAFSEDAD